MKIGITIPAIIDQECADAVVRGIASNVIEKNIDFEFVVLLNVDEYKRKGCLGDKQSIANKYKELEKNPNCVVNVFNHSPPLGLTRSSKFLFEKFMETESEFLLFLDDDCVIINPVPFREFIHLGKDECILHLAFAYDDQSVESPFITNRVYYESENVKVFCNNRIFCTENGTILHRNTIGSILEECKFNPKNNTEDEIGATPTYLKKPLYTVAYKVDGSADVTKTKRWQLAKKNHFIVDSIRHYRKVGWNK